jgi:nucleotide-binding universal stress UspA family protein
MIRHWKQALGWTTPRVRHPEQADRWTWLILTAYTQLRLARGIVADQRLPWERPLPLKELTPTRVLRSFTTLDPDRLGRMQESAEQEARTKLDEQVQRVGKTGGEVAEIHTRLGRPDAEIVGLADELGAGLIVLGSRGLGSLRRALMGSVSDSVVRHAHCPVLIVRE